MTSVFETSKLLLKLSLERDHWVVDVERFGGRNKAALSSASHSGTRRDVGRLSRIYTEDQN